MIVTAQITEEQYNKCNILRDFRENILTNLSKKINKKNIDELIEGIVRKSIIDATERRIDPNWDNQEFIKICTGIFRHVMINIDDANSPFLQNLKSGKITYNTAALVVEFDKNPDKWVEIKKELDARENESMAKLSFVTSVRCGKCGKNAVFMLQFATRSADEAETLHLQCLLCGESWRK